MTLKFLVILFFFFGQVQDLVNLGIFCPALILSCNNFRCSRLHIWFENPWAQQVCCSWSELNYEPGSEICLDYLFSLLCSTCSRHRLDHFDS